MTNFLKLLSKEIDNASLANDGKMSAEYSGTVDTGCYSLNALLSGSIFGGVPNNKVLCFAGEPATGKTFFTLAVEKHFLESNPDALAVKYDTESAITKKMLEDRGIDTERMLVIEPETLQQFRTSCLKVIDQYMEQKERAPMFMSLDSIGMLPTAKEAEDSAAGKDVRDMTRAQLIRGTFRTIRLKLAKAQIPLIITNHVYEAVGSYHPTKVISGGNGLVYAADTIIMLSKSKDRDAATRDVTGVVITAKTHKSRLTKENQEIECLLTYDKGLDRYYGLLPIAEKYGIFKKLAKQYEMPDGTKVFESTIKRNPEKYYTKEILDRIDAACKQEFLYGAGEAPPVEDDESEED